jgi:hypothetical protein
MAYKKSELESESLKVIKEHNLIFIQDVIDFLPCSSSTFYAQELEKSESIKKLLETNKVTMKVGLRRKWYESDNPTTQIALYKLLATDEENIKISSQKTTIDHLKNGGSFNSMSDADLIARIDKLIKTGDKAGT